MRCFGRASLPLIFPGKREHFVGHVEAVHLSRWSNASGGQEHIDAAAGAEVEHRLSRLERD